eukprot:5713095-Prymnesium_polylepis.2
MPRERDGDTKRTESGAGRLHGLIPGTLDRGVPAASIRPCACLTRARPARPRATGDERRRRQAWRR